MAVKLARYVFRKIRGRIIPIRKGLERATKSQNKLADQYWGIPTIPSEIIRLKRGKRALVQELIPKKKLYWESATRRDTGYFDNIRRMAKRIKGDNGIDLDIHGGNVTTRGFLLDTGGNLRNTKLRSLDDAGKEILGVNGGFGTQVKDLAGKSTIMSDTALIEGQSKKSITQNKCTT